MKRLVGLSALLAASGAVTAQDVKPNIVFILADDLGWKDLACYGNKITETPNLDALAKRGIRFTQAYAACPVSSPTRASILTGKYPARLQITNYLVGNRTDPSSPVLPARWKPYLEAREITIAELLKKQGYETGMVGKWHLGGHDSISPWGQGFNWTRLIGKNGLDYYNYSIYIDSYQKEFTDTGKEYLTDKLTDYGIEFIKGNNRKPFFLYLAYSAPHVGIVPRSDKIFKYLRKYGPAQEKFNPYYSAMVESLDDGVGRVVECLRDEGLLDNTIIIFTSDNGGLGLDEYGPTPTSNLPLRKWKGHIYEGGIRVPAIICWPGIIREGTLSDHYFSSIDYLPTICGIVGIENPPPGIDGISILPVLKGNVMPDNERDIYWHYPHFSNQLGRPAGAVRKGDYKLVENYETGKLELYDLKEDISEANDLSTAMPGKKEEMLKLLKEWRHTVKSSMPLANPDYKK
jgi:arylsulfatase A-like enzyme